MRKYLPIFVVISMLSTGAYFLVHKKREKQHIVMQQNVVPNIGMFSKPRQCARPPLFLEKLKISQPVVIDLSQKRYKGMAIYFGSGFKKVLHPKQWEQYAYFSTYTVDRVGNIYLIPVPFISIYPTTFNLQKNLYKVDSRSGKIDIFMHFDDVLPSISNPYGLNAITYDCDDQTLWVAAIDESNYQSQKGVIYHIDPQTKKILQRFNGIDVLSMTIVKNHKEKYLLVGSARDNALYALKINKNKLQSSPFKLLELPGANEHIRKIKVIDKNTFELQSIPFSYALIAQTAKQDRLIYHAEWLPKVKEWKITKK